MLSVVACCSVARWFGVDKLLIVLFLILDLMVGLFILLV